MPGTCLGAYSIKGLIGRGGMGEVYRATDTRLKRDVALKVLPQAVAADPDRLARFEREAQTLAALNHPHIAAIYGIEDSNGTRALVMEFVEGPTLADKIAQGPIRLHEARQIAVQIAEALETAHEAGIIHRDLKPANVKLRPDGTVKVLDFGLAKALEPNAAGGLLGDSPTFTSPAVMTHAGVILGTAAYMSPEQARGKSVDRRTDVWAFGCVLYEMLTGRAAFGRETITDTLAAVLEHEADWKELPADTPPWIRRLIRRCLEKAPRERLRDIGDARLEIEHPPVDDSPPVASRRPRARSLFSLVALAVLIGVAIAGLLAMSRRGASNATFQQITFQRGSVLNARFAPDGQIVYSARWGDAPVQVFSVREGELHSRTLGLRASLASVSRDGTLAIIAGHTLARVPLSGGESPRELQNNAAAADWSPDSADLAVVSVGQGPANIQFAGKELYSSPASLTHLRVSHDRSGIAVVERPQVTRPDAQVRWVATDGTTRVLSSGWREITGLSMAPDGREIWFTAAGKGAGPALYAVSLDGKERKIAAFPGRFTLHDVSPEGAVLVSQVAATTELMVRAKSHTERDFSWLGASTIAGLSDDGQTLLFDDIDDVSGGGHAAFVRSADGAPPIRLGAGTPLALSADGQWALATVDEPPPARLLLYPARAGQGKVVAQGSFGYVAASFLPGARRAVVAINTRTAEYQLLLVNLETGRATAVTPTWMHVRHAVSRDGRYLMAKRIRQQFHLFPLDGAQREWDELPPIKGLDQNDFPAGWSDESSMVYISTPAPDVVGRVLSTIDIRTGERQVVGVIAPRDGTGVTGVSNVVTTPDGQTVAYSYNRVLSTAYVVRGLK